MSLDPQRLEEVLVEVGRRLMAEGEAALGPWGCTTMTVEVCPEEVDSIVRAGACRADGRGEHDADISRYNQARSCFRS